jgi:hypothetical protein
LEPRASRARRACGPSSSTPAPTTTQPPSRPATVNILATCEWVEKGEPLRLIGGSGTGTGSGSGSGKSHLLIALGAEAAIAIGLAFNDAITQTGTEPYRLAHTKTQAGQAVAG